MIPQNRSPSYLIRNPYSYCFRMNVPKDLRPYVAKKEMRYSLCTGYLGVAKLKARYLASQVQILFLHLRRSIPIMSKLSQDQIPALVEKYIKDRFEYLKHMYTDKRYLKELKSYNFDGDDPDSIENVSDNMASLKYQKAHYCQLYLTTGDAESEILADNIMELLQQNDVDQIDKDSPEYKELSTEIHDAESQIFPLEADRLTGGHSYKQEMPKLFTFLRGNRNEQPEPEDNGILFSELISKYAEEHKDKEVTKTYLQSYHHFVRVMGDMPVKSVDRPTIKKFVDRAKRLPKNINIIKEYCDKSVDVILKMDIPVNKIINAKTINKHCNRLFTLFDEAINLFNVYDGKNPVLKVKIEIKDEESPRVYPPEQVVTLSGIRKLVPERRIKMKNVINNTVTSKEAILSLSGNA
jgi:hypothetical protein